VRVTVRGTRDAGRENLAGYTFVTPLERSRQTGEIDTARLI